MIITTPMCLLAFSPVHGLHVPFSPNISAIKMKNYGKIITPQKHPPNQGNWNSPSLGIHITQTWAFTLCRSIFNSHRIPMGSCLPDNWGSLMVRLSSHLLLLPQATFTAGGQSRRSDYKDNWEVGFLWTLNAPCALESVHTWTHPPCPN